MPVILIDIEKALPGQWTGAGIRSVFVYTGGFILKTVTGDGVAIRETGLDRLKFPQHLPGGCCSCPPTMLVRSKQVSPVLGEIFALLVFAGITIFLTMFTRPPEPDGWIRLLLDMFAMLVSSVIIFLMIYSVDLDRERDAHKLEMVEGAERDIYLLLFPDTGQRLFDQWLSVAVGAIIIMVYASLLANKWLGWFS